MTFKLLETAILNNDLPAHGLKKGDVGAVVEVHSRDAFEVEFVRGSGVTQALVTLRKGPAQDRGRRAPVRSSAGARETAAALQEAGQALALSNS